MHKEVRPGLKFDLEDGLSVIFVYQKGGLKISFVYMYFQVIYFWILYSVLES